MFLSLPQSSWHVWLNAQIAIEGNNATLCLKLSSDIFPQVSGTCMCTIIYNIHILWAVILLLTVFGEDICIGYC